MPALSVATDARQICSPGALWLDGATVLERDGRLDEPLGAAEGAARACPPEDVAAVRTMYKLMGLDPTKTRPSSEALLRRVRHDQPLPRINAMVDVCNWCSLEWQLPYGLYDTAHVDGDVELRMGRPGESYPGIRKHVVNVGGRMVLADLQGPFGNPTSDSARTMVTTRTTRALVVIFAPRGLDPVRLERALDVTAERMSAFTGCRVTARQREFRTSEAAPQTAEHVVPPR